jgi:hypothetical protein
MFVEIAMHGFSVKILPAPVNCLPLRAAVSTTEQLAGATVLSSR